MQVLYDISVLGLGQYDPRARTGVARVIENLAYGLANSKQCDLVFCESLSFQVLKGCLNYLESNPRFRGISFAQSSFFTILHSKLLELYQMLNVCSTIADSANNELEDKALIAELMHSLANVGMIVESYPHSIDKNRLSRADIFHATFLPIPEQVQQFNEIHKFITVHDLIPMFCPQFCGKDEDVRIANTLNSINPEIWVFCVSHATKNDLCSYLKNIDLDKVYVTYLAAEPTMFYPCNDEEKRIKIRKKYQIPEGHYILGLSTLEPRKNIDHLIRSFAQLVQQQSIKDLSLVLVGNKGWKYEKILDELSNQHSLKNRIIVTGRVPDEELASLYSGALAFVYPSLYEGFGLPPLEAMQCGVPVITSNTSSLPEVVGDAGILLEPTDTDGLCHNILEIYNQPSLQEAMSVKSLEQAKKFSWEKCTQETLGAYKKALYS